MLFAFFGQPGSQNIEPGFPRKVFQVFLRSQKNEQRDNEKQKKVKLFKLKLLPKKN